MSAMVLGYVFSRYPVLSETFILRELLEMDRLGHQLVVCPLRRQAAPIQHARVGELRARVWFPRWRETVRAQVRSLRRQPRAYWSTLGLALWHNRGDRNLLAGVVAYWARAVAMAAHCEREGVEHVHAHYATHPALVAWIIGRLTGIPYSFTVHAHDIFCHTKMLRQKAEGSSFVAAISAYNAERMRVQCPAARVEIIRCGVEGERYRGWEGERGAHGGRVRVVSVGSLQAYKGHRYLIAACAAVEGVECRIVGGGRLRGKLAAEIERFGVGDRVRLCGPATEAAVAEALRWADVFVLASVRVSSGQMEGIPVALMEAMASGLPVVASRLSGIPELVEPGVSGWLPPPGDAAALADGLERLALDAQLRRRMGERGRQRVRAEYGLRANVARLAACMAEGNAGPRQVGA